MVGTFYIQSAYTMLHSTLEIKRIFDTAKAYDYDFVAIADKKLHGLYQIINLSKHYNMKTLVGLAIDLDVGLESIPVVLYPKDDEGMQLLIETSTKIETSGQKLNIKDLSEIENRVHVIIPMIQSKLITYFKQDEAQVYDIIRQLKDVCSSLYLGLSLQNFELEILIAPKVFRCAEHFDLFIVPTHQTRYLDPLDKEAYDALRTIENGQYLKDEDDLSFYTKEKFVNLYADYGFVFDNSSELIKQITTTWRLSEFSLPVYPNKQQIASPLYLEALAKTGLKKRLSQDKNKDESVYQTRLSYELKVIESMGYADYFLIVFDFVRYAKSKGILVGPGRGSAAGSLVSI